MSFSIPPSPPNFRGNTFNPVSYPSTSNTGLTVQQGQAFFVSYPQAQGRVTLLDTNVTGTLRTSDNIFLDNSGNYIQFPDGTRQSTAILDFSGYAFTDVSNVFLDLNTFNANLAIGGVFGVNYIEYPDGSRQYSAPTDDVNTVYNDISNTFLSPTIQKFQGSNTTSSSTAPLQFTNVSTGEYGSLFVDPNPNNDLTLYSNQSGGGLTISNPTNSFTINPTTTNTASFLNPIVSNASITGQSLGLNTTGADAYTIYSNTSPVNYGLVIANTTGANGSLTVSNNGGTSTTLTSTSTGLSINDNLLMNSKNINNVVQLNGIAGGTLTLGTQSSSSVNITGGSLTAGNSLGINSANGSCVFNYYTANNLTMNLNSSETLLIANAGTSIMTFSSTEINASQNLNMNSNNILNIASQTYPLTSSNQVATISYVNQAISSQGGGDAILNTPNLQTFTGPIDFSGNTNAITQSNSTNNSTIATTAFVQNLFDSMFSGQLIGVVSNTTGFNGPPPTSLTFIQNYNSNISSNNLYLQTYNANIGAYTPVSFTLTFPTSLYPSGATPIFIVGTGLNLFATTSLQSLNMQVSFLNNTQIRCTTGGSQATGGTTQITGQFLISW
jgi:hypothetical protein